MQQGGTFDLLDLKIRVPPHLAHKFNVVSSQQHPEELQRNAPQCTAMQVPAATAVTVSPEKPDHGQKWVYIVLTRPYFPISACFISLMPFFCFTEARTNPNHNTTMYCGCAHLLVAPITLPIILGFNAYHANCKWFTYGLACLSLFLGNTAAVAECSSSSFCQGAVRLWLISFAMGAGVLQMLLLINKNNVFLVMISTASAVLVCCLAVVAPLLPNPAISYRCYQSTTLPIMWLFWQSTMGARGAR